MPNNPHDALFRFTFGQPENAAALLRSCVPAEIASRVDWDSLVLTNASYVDAAAEWRHSDLVFTARVEGRDAFIFVLVEHQSSTDPLMALRMLGYAVRLWEAFVRDNPERQRLPAILPVVVYHGASGWSAPTRVLDLVDLDDGAKAAFAAHLPDLRFVLDDLAAQGDDRVRDRPLPAAAMLAALSLLGFPRREAMGVLRRLAGLFAALPADRAGTEALAAVVCYFLEVAEPEPDAEQVRRFFEGNVGKSAAEVAMSAAERLRQQGREEGLAEGRAAMLLSLLTLKFGAPSADTRQRVLNASTEEIEAFGARVLNARTLRDVLNATPAKPARTPRSKRSGSSAKKKR